MTTILVIDDEADLVTLVRYNLEREGWRVRSASDGLAGYEAAKRDLPDLILLDLMLPGMDGLEVCRRLRAEARTARIPILMLTAKGGESDRVVGLEMGADDYLSKPFSPRELVARVKAVLRRAAPAPDAEAARAVAAGDLQLDPGRHEVTVRGKPVSLTATEFRLLHALMRRPGQVFSRDRLIDGAIGEDTAVVDRTIDVHVTALRRKLGKAGPMIETVRGVGYRLRDAP
ncbi:MAG: response regulator transcription factor [Candidatus Brocadiae bacterium]|nr:response regulator transcription factor [Candidatus Brocadiia bacterium]